MAPERRNFSPENQFQFVRAGKMHFFCPLCKVHQSTSTIQRVQLKHHGQVLVISLALGLLFFPLFGWNGSLLYLPVWAGFEFFYRLRKRQALICQSCGFDPFLYKQDVHRARTALRQHWETRIEKEKLFHDLPLKNYKTSRVKPGEKEVPDELGKSPESLMNRETAPPKSP